MKIVIDIDEEYYEIIKHDVNVRKSDYKPYNIIANGTPLPKGHEYIDRQAVMDLIFNTYPRDSITSQGKVSRVHGEIDLHELCDLPIIKTDGGVQNDE